MNFIRRPPALALRALCVLAIVMAAFAHRPAVAMPDVPDRPAAIVLPDGSLADICFGGGEDEGSRGHARLSPCDFCLIAGSAGLDGPADGVFSRLSGPAETLFFPRSTGHSGASFPPAAPPRGPPSLSL